MEKVVDLRGRLEEWKPIFSSNDHFLQVSVSNHGRISFLTQRDRVVLDLVSSSNFILSLQNGIDAVCGIADSDYKEKTS